MSNDTVRPDPNGSLHPTFLDAKGQRNEVTLHKIQHVPDLKMHIRTRKVTTFIEAANALCLLSGRHCRMTFFAIEELNTNKKDTKHNVAAVVTQPAPCWITCRVYFFSD